MSFQEEHCDPKKINSSSTRTRPIPPITPPTFHQLRGGTQIMVRNALRVDPDREDRILSPEGQHADNEHFYLCKKLCKTGKFTKAFDGIQFSREEFYLRSLIRIAITMDGKGGSAGDGILGFSNFWHKVRTPQTKLYFVVVDPAHHRRGVAEALMADLYRATEAQGHSPHRLELDVNKTNPTAVALYHKHHFKTEGESLHGTCHYMAREWETKA